jgi:hypothetical protein
LLEDSSITASPSVARAPSIEDDFDDEGTVWPPDFEGHSVLKFDLDSDEEILLDPPSSDIASPSDHETVDDQDES